jgi:hypothetical protein
MAAFDPLTMDPLATASAGNAPRTAMAGRTVMSSYERGLAQAGFGPGGNEKAGDYVWTPGVSSMSTGATSGGQPWGGSGGGGTVDIPRWGAANSGGVQANWRTLQRNANRLGNAVYSAGRGYQKLKTASQVSQLNSLLKQRDQLAQDVAAKTDPDTMMNITNTFSTKPAVAGPVAAGKYANTPARQKRPRTSRFTPPTPQYT